MNPVEITATIETAAYVSAWRCVDEHTIQKHKQRINFGFTELVEEMLPKNWKMGMYLKWEDSGSVPHKQECMNYARS